MAKIYSSPRALIVGKPKVTALQDEEDKADSQKESPEAGKPRGKKTELVGRSAKSRHSCSQLLAAITAPFDVGHYSATYADSFPRSKIEIQLEKMAIQQAAKRAGLFGIWTLEFQKRGAPHWHMLLWERQPGAREKFTKWWHRHTENDHEAAIVVRQGDEAKASWYFNFHQHKEDQTPLVKVGRWWGKIDNEELEKWIHCNQVANADGREIIWLKRFARRMHRADYRQKLVRFLAKTPEQRKKMPDPRTRVSSYWRKEEQHKRRKVWRARKARSSLGEQGFTWFLKEEHHAHILLFVDKLLNRPKDPF